MSINLNVHNGHAGAYRAPEKSMAGDSRALDAQEIAQALGGAKRERDQWVCLCPTHDDHDPSLAIADGENGKPLVSCRAGCNNDKVIAELKRRNLWPNAASKPEKREPPRIVAEYNYRDERGELRYQVVRYAPKDFRQRRPNGSPDSWIWNMQGVEPLPYRLPELLVSDPAAETVYIAEGEKDVNNLIDVLGLVATCNHGGAGKWRTELSRWLQGRDVVILPDNDDPGRAHALDIARKLSGIAASIKIVELPGLPPKGDVSDWSAVNDGREQLEQIASAAPAFNPEAAAISQTASPPRQRTERTILDIHAPFSIAKTFIDSFFTHNYLPKLHYHKDSFYSWNGCSYPEMEKSELISGLYHFLEKCQTLDPKGNARPVKPNKAMVGNILHALQAAAHLPENISAPSWLGETPREKPNEIVACQNGLLHLPTMTLLPHTPSFFNYNALEFNYVKTDAQPVEFLTFLHTLWPNDEESICVLQEMFGYFLVPDTSQQKLFMLIGPPRSGKGTIGRILRQLVGLANHVAPTLASLGTEFGLQPLIGRLAAIVGDARLGGKADQQAITERLLSISGEDSITVNRKFLMPWTGQLLVRFLIITNELPYIIDKSGALASRYIMLQLTESFLGKEDLGIMRRIEPELPLILNWAIEGWHRLNERGYFLEPTSSLEAKQELEDLSSPIKAFLRERCRVAAGLTIGVNRIFEVWCEWCRTQGREHPGSVQSLGRDLRAAVPGLKTAQRRNEKGEQVRVYEGVALKY